MEAVQRSSYKKHVSFFSGLSKSMDIGNSLKISYPKARNYEDANVEDYIALRLDRARINKDVEKIMLEKIHEDDIARR